MCNADKVEELLQSREMRAREIAEELELTVDQAHDALTKLMNYDKVRSHKVLNDNEKIYRINRVQMRNIMF